MTTSLSASADQRRVTATYRLQLHREFTFDDAAARVPYLAALGVSHLYLSPVLTAVPGSQHGYDVVDHRTVNPELGGRERLEALADTAHRHGLGLIVDVVPNHMALVAPLWRNAQVWEVLRSGKTARTAHWFDIDWAYGPLGLPVLGASVAEAIAAGEFSIDRGRADEGLAAGEPVLRYYDHIFPLTGTAAERALADSEASAATLTATQWEAVLAEQPYRLGHWREDAHLLNYRRFFEVDGLIGVRVEESDVFEQTHRELLDLHHRGVIDGFRIDHPDGLADPEGYLTTLSRACRPGTPIWVEKILHGTERLPRGWDCSGTTGYDPSAVLLEAFSPGGAGSALDRAWAQTGAEPAFSAVERIAKTEAVDTLLGPEMDRLTRSAQAALPGIATDDLRAALRALLIATAAYRIYLFPGRTARPEDASALQDLIERAVQQAPEHGNVQEDVLRAVGRVLGEPEASVQDPLAARDLAIRFQQTSGPVMAKGIEDTAFYRWHRQVGRNEVGADPAAPGGADGVAALHAWAQHQGEHWPDGMTNLSTHDTKRSEDVRARLAALAWHPDLWLELSASVASAADEAGVDRATGHLIWQTIAAISPDSEADPAESTELSERLAAYLTKAIREGKQRTSWIDVDQDYERRVLRLADELLRGHVGTRVAQSLGRVRADIRVLTLAQKAVQLLLPGVPDVYQGSEALDLSLVDPDNRRPVDYAARAALLEQEEQRSVATGLPQDLSAATFALTRSILRLRRDWPDLVAGGYRPVPVEAAAAVEPREDLGAEPAGLAFARTATTGGTTDGTDGGTAGGTGEGRGLIVLAARHAGAAPDPDSTPALVGVRLPGGEPSDRPGAQAPGWLNVVTGQRHAAGAVVQVTVRHPVAVLVSDPSGATTSGATTSGGTMSGDGA